MKNPSPRALPNLTEGSILKALFALSVPIVLSNLLQTAYQLTDTFWVGRLGPDAVAAVSLSFPVVFLMIALGGGFTMAGTILVAQYKGKGDLAAVGHVSSQTLLMSLLVSIALSVIGFLISEPILRLMGAEPAVLPQATLYLKYSFLGLVFTFVFFMYQSLMRGVGDVKTPMLVILGTVLLNFVLDPLFIMGWGPIPGFGVAGAAMATLGTQALAAIVGLLMLFHGRYGIRIRLSEMKPDFSLIKKMFFLGLPASIELSTRALGLMIMSFLVASFGTLTVASYGIGVRIFSFVVIPAFGLAMATSTLVGQNMGAGKIERAEKTAQQSAVIGFIMLALAGLFFYLFAEPATRLFIPDSPEVIRSGSQFVRIMALSFGFVGLQQALNGAFMGSGNTMSSMMLSIVSLWVFQFPLAYVLSQHTGLAEWGIWWAVPISNVLAALATIALFLTGRWKRKRLMEPSALQEKVIGEAMVEEGMG